MLINQVSSKYNISLRTLRYYEELGLLSLKRNESNIRYFTKSQLNRLEEILLFKSFNFSLNEIKSIITMSNNTFLNDKLHSELKNIEDAIFDLSHKHQLLNSILQTFGSDDLSKQNVKAFVKEQIYFKNERMLNMINQDDTIIIEIGANLIPLATKEDQNSLIHSVKVLRNEIKSEYDIDVDLIRIRDNIKDLSPNEYQIINNNELYIKKVIDTSDRSLQIKHIITHLNAMLL